MTRWIAAAVLAAALPALAHAEPKEVIIDNCAKISAEIMKAGDRHTMTVKCTGEANDPKVRDGGALPITSGSSIVISPSVCANGHGGYNAC